MMPYKKTIAWGIGALALVVLSTLIFPLEFGITSRYWRVGDCDAIPMTQALYFNSGYAPTYFDHPGISFFMAVAQWYKLLYAFHAIPIMNFDQFSQLPDFRTGLNTLVRADRAFSIVLGTWFSISIGGAIYALTRNRYWALFAALLFTVTEGFTCEVMQTRSEMFSAACCTTALWFALEALRCRRPFLRLGLLFAVGGLCVVGPMAKILAIPNVLLMPWFIAALVAAVNMTVAPVNYSKKVVLILTIPLAYAGSLVLPVMYRFIFGDVYKSALDAVLSYHALLLLYFIAVIIAVQIFWGKRWQNTAAMSISFLTGTFAAFHLNQLWFSPWNWLSVLDFKNWASRFSSASNDHPLSYLIKNVLKLQAHEFEIHLAFPLLALVLCVAFFAMRKNRRLGLCLLVLAGGFQVLIQVAQQRYIASMYFVYSEYLLVLALIVILYHFWTKARHRLLATTMVALTFCGFYLHGLTTNLSHLHDKQYYAVNFDQSIESFCFFLSIGREPMEKLLNAHGGCPKALTEPKP